MGTMQIPYRGRRMSRRQQRKEQDDGRGRVYTDMAEDLVRQVVEGSRGWQEGVAGKAVGVVRLVRVGRGGSVQDEGMGLRGLQA